MTVVLLGPFNLPGNQLIMQRIISRIGSFLLFTGSLLMGACAAPAQKTSPAPASPPKNVADNQADEASNIVFILIDDLGWMDLSVQGNPWYPTPNIDRLASRGVRFTDAYAASPVCSPSRAAMMSGISGARTGITDFIPGHWRPYEQLTVPTNRTQFLPADYKTYAETLRDAGYATAYFGKWHLGWGAEHSPYAQGFDTAHVQRGWGHFLPPVKFIPEYPEAEKGDYLTDLLTDMTVDFIEEKKNDKFLVVCAHFAVHLPLEAPDEMVDAAGKRAQPENRVYNPTYVAMIESVDAGVGRILDKIDALALAEETMIVLTSDNGGLRQIFNKSDEVIATTNEPLRVEKGAIYEGGLRVPFMISQPGSIPVGVIDSTPVTGLDLYPTFVDVAGLPAIDSLDGKSLTTLWTHPGNWADRQIFFHYPHYHHSRPAAAVREGQYKLIRFFDQAAPELYDLRRDIGEAKDLAAVRPALAARLLKDLNHWLEENNAPLPVPNPAFDQARRMEWGPRPE